MYNFSTRSLTLILFTCIVVFLIGFFLFSNYLFSIGWFIGALSFVLIFFSQVRSKTFQWHAITEQSFTKKLFGQAFLLRLLALLIVSILAEINTGKPFYVGSLDAQAYYSSSTYALKLLNEEGFQSAVSLIIHPDRAPDDYGMFFFLMLVHTFTFKSVYVTKIVFCLLSSFTVVQGYKLARLIWDEQTARLAGLFLMVFPLSLFYGVVYLKANLITFLIINSSYLVTKTFTLNKFTVRMLTLILFQVIFLFFLRTATGAIMILLIFGAYFINYFKGSRFFSIFLGILIIGFFVLVLNYLGLTEVYYQRLTGAAASFGETKFENVQDVNRWAQIGSLPLFIVASVFAPFPTLVNYQGVAHGPFNYYIPGLLVWNFLGIFALFGLIYAIRKFRKASVMLWGFSLGYTYVLIDTALFTSTRFSYSTMPVLLILAAVGFRHTKAIRYWRLYLVIISIVIIGWNYFKLGGRGLL